MSCDKRDGDGAPTPSPTNKKSPFLCSRRTHVKKHKRHHRFTTMKRSTTVRVHRFISNWRKWGGEKLHGKDQKMHVKNFKLYMENKTIQENNKQLRMKLLLLRQENLALLSQYQQRFFNHLQDLLPPSHVIS